MADSVTSKLRPIDAFVKYFLDVKPYHTKILEVVERYKFAEDMTVDVTDTVFTGVKYLNTPLCRQVGFGVLYDESGFSAPEACDLFQCLGGYGLIWDNSDLTSVHPISRIDQDTQEVIVDGNWVTDERIRILRVDNDSLVLDGDHAAVFDSHKLFLIAPYNVYTVIGSTSNTIMFNGNIVAELLAKREFKLVGSMGIDGNYGIADAVYSTREDITTLIVASNKNFNRAYYDAATCRIETEAQPRNQGFYQVKSAEFVNGATTVYLKDGTTFPVQTTSNNGSLQLRTALTPPRTVWLTIDSGTQESREYRVADSFFNVNTGQTHLVLAESLFTGETYTEVRTYGYMTYAGFDNNEECDVPKPTNVHALLGESLKITVNNYDVPPVAYVGSSDTSTVINGLDVVVNVPTGLNEGDYMLAAVMRRSAFTSVPDGWTLVSSSPSATGGSWTIWTDVFSKIYLSTDPTSYTWSQTSSDRIQGAIHAFRSNIGGSIAISDSVSEARNHDTTISTTVAPLTPTSKGYAIAIAASILGAANANIDEWTVAGQNWKMLGTSAAKTLRLAFAGERVTDLTPLSGTFTSGFADNGNDGGWTKTTIVLKSVPLIP